MLRHEEISSFDICKLVLMLNTHTCLCPNEAVCCVEVFTELSHHDVGRRGGASNSIYQVMYIHTYIHTYVPIHKYWPRLFVITLSL